MKTRVSDKLVESIVEEALADISNSRSRFDESYIVQSKKFEMRTETLSEKSMKQHQVLLDGYVKSLNDVSTKLDAATKDGIGSNHAEFRGLKIDESHNLNAAYLHGLFFDNVGDPNPSISTDSIPHMRLSRDFGDFNRWQKDFIACAMSARSGWAVTCFNSFLRRYINVIVDLHDVHVPLGSFPVIVIDCWEHSYINDFGTDRKSYVYAMMRELNWRIIGERFERAERISKVVSP